MSNFLFFLVILWFYLVLFILGFVVFYVLGF